MTILHPSFKKNLLYFNIQMKAVILLCLVGAALAAPGGYTGIGGVYKNMKMSHDVMSHAMKASKCL